MNKQKIMKPKAGATLYTPEGKSDYKKGKWVKEWWGPLG